MEKKKRKYPMFLGEKGKSARKIAAKGMGFGGGAKEKRRLNTQINIFRGKKEKG